MMKKLFNLTLILAAMLAAGCSDDDSPSVPIQIITGTENIVFEDTGKTFQNITFIASTDWTIQPENGTLPEWLYVNPTSGKGGKSTVNIRVLEKNLSQTDRTVTLQLQAGSSEPTLITVTQKFEPVIDPVKILPRKLRGIVVNDDLGGTAPYEFTYDAQNRLSSFLDYTFTYTASGAKVYQKLTDNSQYIYTTEYNLKLEDGKVANVSGYKHIYEVDPEVDETTDYAFAYVYNERGFMSERIDSKPAEQTLQLEWERGKLMSLETIGNGKVIYSYGEHPNNLNIDMVAFMELLRSNSDDFSRILSCGGIRSQRLPVSMGVMVNNSYVYQSTMEYTIDDAGYITKMVEVSAPSEDINGNKVESRTYIYSFVYE